MVADAMGERAPHWVTAESVLAAAGFRVAATRPGTDDGALRTVMERGTGEAGVVARIGRGLFDLHRCGVEVLRVMAVPLAIVPPMGHAARPAHDAFAALGTCPARAAMIGVTMLDGVGNGVD